VFTTLFGIFVILHGLVHLWFMVLSFGWVEFQQDMGWTGKSWLFSGWMRDAILNPLSGISFILSALGFVISGIGVLTNAAWTNTALLVTSIFSSLILIIFWDSATKLIVQKGLIGLLINIGIIALIALKN